MLINRLFNVVIKTIFALIIVLLIMNDSENTSNGSIVNQESEKYVSLSIHASQVFNPNSPVSEKDLFAGRFDQVSRALDVIFQRGQHAIIFGERGVGKTSLANVLCSFIPKENQSGVYSIRINCDKADTFSTVWKKVFDEMQLTSKRPEPGFNQSFKELPITSANVFSGDNVSPNDVRIALLKLPGIPVLVIDEFDRLEQIERRLFADLIKSLSDHTSTATIILIGVGESIEQLIEEHQSVARAMVQIQMPRMSNEEIKSIVKTGIDKLGMTINENTLRQIILLVKGLPHYAHLLALHSVKIALNNHSMIVDDSVLNSAIEKSIKESQYSISAKYLKATKSQRKDNLFSDVLLACALAEVNELGEFAAQDIREPMYKITHKTYNIPAYAKHLNEFSESKRENILIKSGGRRTFRYKFNDPLMQPYVIMQGIMSRKINPTILFQNENPAH